jgi:hypothetical protein
MQICVSDLESGSFVSGNNSRTMCIKILKDPCRFDVPKCFLLFPILETCKKRVIFILFMLEHMV